MQGVNLAGLSESGLGFVPFGRHSRKPQPSSLIEWLRSHHPAQYISRFGFTPGFGQANRIL
jgi:hypothetical protein